MDGSKYTRCQLVTAGFETRHLDPEEVVLALQIMDKDGDNVAHFGINGCYLFSEFDPEYGQIQ
jgi:hypothetical protein